MSNTFLMALVLMVVIGAGYYFIAGPSASKSMRRRLQGIRERHSKSAEIVTQVQLRKITANHQTRVDSFFQQLIPKPALLRQRLEKSGKSWTLTQYAMLSLGLTLFILILGMVRGMSPLFVIFLALAIGLGVPHKMVDRAIKKRMNKFALKFADAIDLMVRGLRSGLPITETMAIVATEIPGPVGLEFRGVVDKMRIGRTMEVALQETADRINTPEFQFFVITLAIQRETGGNLAETLNNLSDVLRKRVAMRLKIKAMSSEAKASAYIIGVLPFIVFGLISFVNWDYMAGFFKDERLMIAGGGGILWMAIGAFIMSRMIAFEI